MRQIRKKGEPIELTAFRAAHVNDPNFGYGLVNTQLRRVIQDSLIDEQRGICAYTGRRIDLFSSHIEHLKAQEVCRRDNREAGRKLGQDVAYSNMVACFPRPNYPQQLPYGAHPKGSWPDDAEAGLFLSPLTPGCESRFSFNLQGEVSPARSGDLAAAETIKRLGLAVDDLNELRKAAIGGTLGLKHHRTLLDLPRARRRLSQLRYADGSVGHLEPFCFVLCQALDKHIRRLEAIRESKREARR